MQQPFLATCATIVYTIINLLETSQPARCPTLHPLLHRQSLYDQPNRIPIDESEALIPGSIYGETKYMAERLLEWMDRLYGIKYCCLRYFNACGAHPDGHIGEAHDPESHLIPLVSASRPRSARCHPDLTGQIMRTPDGTCIRDYVHVLDLARAHILALEALADG